MSFYKGKRVLVAGGSGFVGSHFVERLIEEGAQVRVPTHLRPMEVNDARIEMVKCDLANLDDCLRVLKDIEIVVNASGAVSAAAVGPLPHMGILCTNLITSVQLMQASWQAGVERFLVLSSHTTYPAIERPLKEEEVWSGPPHPSYFGYSWMRRYLEKLSEYVAEKSKMKIALVRPTAIYGEYDNFDPQRGHVIPALVRKAVERMDPYEVWGTGEEVRDFTHGADVARGALMILEKHAVCDPVNIAYGEAIKIKDVVKYILKAADYSDAKIVFNSSKPTTIPFRMVDISKAKKLVGYEPQISLEEGMRRTVEFFRKKHKGKK